MKSNRIVIAITSLVLFLSCATNPFTGKETMALPGTENSALFPASFQQYNQFLSENKVIKSTSDAAMVTRVGQKIAVAAERWLNANGYVSYLKDYKWEYNLVDDKTINSFGSFFDKVGGGMDASMSKQIELVNTAQKYGLNTGQFLTTVAGKLDILTKYGFPKGVNDLADMVVKSQVLGDTLSVAQNFADQIMDSPEKAFEYAAQLQTLGGSFSQLGDGAQLLYMAQNDLKGLNDQLINATRGIATFNEKSGQFEISANERLRLRGLKNLGIDADKIEATINQINDALKGKEIDGARRAMKAAYQREMDTLEANLPFLASVGSVSPYIGLFGTVWGIMNSFRGLANVQQATLASVAPGIAEALVATAIGLFAAIPAVVAYNRNAADIDRLSIRFETFIEEFSNILQRQQQVR